MSKKTKNIKCLNGAELVPYISERQSRQIRGLIQSRGINPCLVAISTDPEHKPSQVYLKLKQEQAEELGITFKHLQISQDEASEVIKKLNTDPGVHGIIIQLPLQDPSKTEGLLNLISPQKDIDGMGQNALVTPATAQAIQWLLAGYAVDLKDKKILIIGKGRLVGAPLIKIFNNEGFDVTDADIETPAEKLKELTLQSDIVISAAGSAGLIKEDWLHDKQVIIDAGTSEQGGKLAGDLDPSVYESQLSLSITPQRGGVGPLTISSIFKNLPQLIDKHIS